MNANELADKLDEAADDLESEKIFAWEERAAATMLRQQQAEIESLKAVLKEVINGMGHSHQAKFKEYLK